MSNVLCNDRSTQLLEQILRKTEKKSLQVILDSLF